MTGNQLFGLMNVSLSGAMEAGGNASSANPQEKWQKEMLDTHVKGCDISIMVWGAI